MNTGTLCHQRTGIGNFICMTPAIRALASMDPSGKVDICTDTDWMDSRKDGLLDLWKKLPFVQDVYVFDFSNPDEVKFVKDYKTFYYAAWSTYGPAALFFQKQYPYDPPKWNYRVKHEIDYYYDIVVDKYGYKGKNPDQMVAVAEKPILDLKGKKLIVICNGSFGELAVGKKWQKFASLVKELRNLYGTKIAIAKVGYQNELSDVKDVDFDFVNKLTFTETLKVIDQCSLMITTDTGLMHGADALKKPLIVLWGMAVLEKNRPVNGTSRVINLGLPCQPCYGKSGYKTCEKLSCIDDITIGEVMYNVREVLNVNSI